MQDLGQSGDLWDKVFLIPVHRPHSGLQGLSFLSVVHQSFETPGARQRRITPSEISIILHMIRKPNSMIILLFIQNNS